MPKKQKREVRLPRRPSGVTLRENYDGYFKHLVGKVLHVDYMLYCDEGDSCYWFKIKEIEEAHLIKSKHFRCLDGVGIG